MLYLNENASKLWYDNIYIRMVWDSLGMNGMSQRWTFSYHFAIFPLCCSFPQRSNISEETPLSPGCCRLSWQGPSIPLMSAVVEGQGLISKGKR